MHLSTARIRLLGASRLAMAAADALADLGVGALIVWDNDEPDPDCFPDSLAATGADALHHWLRRRHRGTPIQAARHWAVAGADLTLVTPGYREADRALTDELVAVGAPHLLLRPDADGARGAIVGPLVCPGASPCVRCLDLWRTAADPAWPHQLLERCRARGDVDPAWARWASGAALPAMLAALGEAGSQPDGDLAGRTQESRPDRPELGLRAWPFHPDCGCRSHG